MIEALQNLLKLQTLEFGEAAGKAAGKEIADLRNVIPAPILGHYDRLRVRGKKGLAAIRNQVCTGCHMSVPIGKITVIMRGADIQLCENCGRYLYLPDPVEAGKAEQAPAVPAVDKPRKRKAAATAVPAAN